MANDKSSLRTMKSRIAYFGAAHSGTRDARLMRLTSTALLPLGIAFIWNVVALSGKDFAGVRAYLHHPLPAILTILFVLASAYHMRAGMQSIIDDYLHRPVTREWATVANIFFCVCVGVACIYALLVIGVSPLPQAMRS
jgi:succinate dehydrogenase / fumarate reductase, membrane anchor subunit